jgi:uncharacterized protein YbaA (DUF1428 family)
MARYVDGFLLPIKAENVEKYREIAQAAGEIWKEHGALEYIEAVGDDIEPEKMVSFRKSANAAEDETVIFAWIVYESREERDRINALVMEDERLKESMNSGDMPFDVKRMAYGGFKTIVEF